MHLCAAEGHYRRLKRPRDEALIMSARAIMCHREEETEEALKLMNVAKQLFPAPYPDQQAEADARLMDNSLALWAKEVMDQIKKVERDRKTGQEARTTDKTEELEVGEGAHGAEELMAGAEEMDADAETKVVALAGATLAGSAAETKGPKSKAKTNAPKKKEPPKPNLTGVAAYLHGEHGVYWSAFLALVVAMVVMAAYMRLTGKHMGGVPL